jgi:hypothetical protein
MKLAHSIATTLFVSVAALTSACGDEATDDGGTTGGTGGSATGGTATGGTATGGTATGGTAGSGTGGTATGGAAGSGTGGAAGSATGGTTGTPDHPTDPSQAGIEAFLQLETYKAANMGWRPEATPGEDGAPHLAAMRYFNETIIASKAAGNRPPSMGQHTAGSMSIKEILEGTTVIGKAVTLRTDSMNVFYCVSSADGRCGTGTMANVPVYSTTSGGSCACHGNGANSSHSAIPAP